MGVQTGDPDRLDLGLVFELNGGQLPCFIEADGCRLVLVSHEEYGELVAARSKLLRLALQERMQQPAKPRLGLSTIERDPEVADWLREQFRGGVTVTQLRAACLERFGAERTPSHPRIQRFREKLLAKA